MKIHEYQAKERDLKRLWSSCSKGVGLYSLSRTGNFECGWGSKNPGVYCRRGETPNGASRVTASVF